jgi:WD40 repeat protein
MFRKIALLVVSLCVAAVAADKPKYLFVWAGDDAKKSQDFLAVVDADPQSKTYGQTVATVSVPGTTGTPHHTELVMSKTGHLLANQFESGQSIVFDVHDPLHPTLLYSYGDLAGYAHPHTYIRDEKQNILATFQYHGMPHMAGHHMPAEPGGLVRFTEAGKVLASGSAADASAKGELIRPYSVVELPKLDRAVTTNTSMHEEEGTSRTIQIWRLHDLKLLQTIALPAPPTGKNNELPGEPVIAADGKSVLIHTFMCGLYEVTDIATKPAVRTLRTLDDDVCGVPVRIAHYWVASLSDKHAVAVYDLTTPDVKEVSRVTLDEKQKPHWLSPDTSGRRLVINSGEHGDHRIFIFDFDPATGALKLDEKFRDQGSDRAGVSMDGKKWGDAFPHGAVFSR